MGIVCSGFRGTNECYNMEDSLLSNSSIFSGDHFAKEKEEDVACVSIGTNELKTEELRLKND